jgi:hypothetical protein
MIQNHLRSGENQNHLYMRRYLGSGRYYQRGVCKGLGVGDVFASQTHPGRNLIVDKLLSVKDSNGSFEHSEETKGALYEAELVDKSFDANSGMEYQVIHGV